MPLRPLANEEEQLRSMIEALVLHNLQAAYGNFTQNPSANHWNSLQRAMVTYQKWRFANEEGGRRAIEGVRDEPIGKWSEQIVKSITGQTIDELLKQNNV